MSDAIHKKHEETIFNNWSNWRHKVVGRYIIHCLPRLDKSHRNIHDTWKSSSLRLVSSSVASTAFVSSLDCPNLSPELTLCIAMYWSLKSWMAWFISWCRPIKLMWVIALLCFASSVAFPFVYTIFLIVLRNIIESNCLSITLNYFGAFPSSKLLVLHKAISTVYRFRRFPFSTCLVLRRSLIL